MPNSYKDLERRMSRKFKEIDKITKNSFHFIREDMAVMEKSMEAMKTFLKKEDKRLKYAKKEDNKLREEFRKDVDDFTQKITQLRIALSEVRAIQNEVVVMKDLARIEDRIRLGFREEVNGLKDKVSELKEQVKESKKKMKEQEKRLSDIENGKIKGKKGWFSKGKGKNSSSE
jgi:chromosome segregation ATPase